MGPVAPRPVGHYDGAEQDREGSGHGVGGDQC